MGVVLEVVNSCTTSQRQRNKHQHNNAEHDQPRLVFEQVADVLHHAALFGLHGNYPLASSKEGDKETDHSSDGEDHHDLFKAHGLIAIAHHQHQRTQKYLNDELSHHHSHETVSREAVALGHVAG